MEIIKRILSSGTAAVMSLTALSGIPFRSGSAFAEDAAAQTYESIYGSLIYTEMQMDSNIPNTDYADQMLLTEIFCKKYCLEDVNGDGIKELIVHYGMGGTDEQFYSYCKYQDGDIVWGETLCGIYLSDDCWLSADGEGLITVSDFLHQSELTDRFSYGKWMPEKTGGTHPVTIPGEKAGTDPATPSYDSYGSFIIAGLADGEKPSAYPSEMMARCGKKLVWHEPSDRAVLAETIPVVSDDSGECGDKLTWSFDAETGTLTISGTGSMWERSGEKASKMWEHCKDQIQTVVIRDGVTSIGKNAFSECINLTAVTIPDGVAYIGDYAFWGCPGLNSISIPDGVSYIGEEAFRWCDSLTEIRIPDSVTHIGGNAFEDTAWISSRRSESPLVIVNSILIDGNRAVGDVTVPDGVTMIAPFAFEKSQTVTKVTLPKGVGTVGASAFRECTNLTEVIIPDSVETIENSAFYYSGLERIVIPDSVGVIRESAFQSCYNLHSVTLPKKLEWIGAGAFKECRNLKSITLPRALYFIEKDSFSFSGIQQIRIPFHVRGIYEGAFSNCSDLTDIIIENSACEIVDSPDTISNGSSSSYTIHGFTGSTAESYAEKYGLTFIPLSGDGICGEDLYWDYNAVTDKLTITGSGEMDNWVGQGQLAELSPWPRSIKSVSLPDQLKTIGSDAFLECQLTEVTVPEGVEEINWRAFGYSKIVSVTLPKSLIKIRPQVFMDCAQLQEITIPENVNEIGAMAFSFCKNLESVTILNPGCLIDDSMITFSNNSEDSAFTGTIYGYAGSTAEAYAEKHSLKFVALDDSAVIASGDCGENGDHVKWKLNEEGTLHIFGSGKIKEWKTMIAAPKYSAGAVKKPSDYSVNFTGESIPWYELRGKIKKIVVSSGVTSIPNCCFWGCTEVTAADLADSVASVGEYAFYNCSSLPEMTLPRSLTVIDSNTFFFCTSLNSVHIPSGLTEIHGSAFEECRSLTDISLPDSIEKIGAYAFCSCDSLTSISVPENTKEIDSGVFCDCSELANIQIPEDITRIGNHAFYGCTSLTDIVIPDSVTEIGQSAFYGCTGLTGFTVGSGNPNYASYDGALLDKEKTVLIQYPAGSTRNSYTVPESVTRMEALAIGTCSYLKTITVSDPECVISDSANAIPDTVTICGYLNSTAEAYAEKYHRTFIALDAEAPVPPTEGDYNGDGTLSAADAVLLARFLAEDEELLSEQRSIFTGADPDGDGFLTLLDMRIILRLIVSASVHMT